MAIGPDRVHEEWRQDLWGCQVRPRRDCQIPGSASMGYRPRGCGARRWRGWNIPLPCLMRLPLNGFRWNTPTSRRVPRLLPPPGRGRAVDWRLARWPCQGTRQDFGRVFTSSRGDALPRQCIDGISPRGEGLTGRGTEHPPPLSPVSQKNLSRWITPTSRRFAAIPSRKAVPWAEAGSR